MSDLKVRPPKDKRKSPHAKAAWMGHAASDWGVRLGEKAAGLRGLRPALQDEKIK
jgi:hypothetical protein